MNGRVLSAAVGVKKPDTEFAAEIEGQKKRAPGEIGVPVDVPDKVGIVEGKQFERRDGRTEEAVEGQPY